jgi:hypothetical protein
MRIPEIEQFLTLFEKEMEKKRPCCIVIKHNNADKIIPDFEQLMYSHRYSFRNMTQKDTSFLNMIQSKSDADFMFYIEKVEFNRMVMTVNYVKTEYKTARIVFQLWDLRKMKLVERGIADGEGESYANFFKEAGSKNAVINACDGIIKDFPKCR